jgi:hypothetical protein
MWIIGILILFGPWMAIVIGISVALLVIGIALPAFGHLSKCPFCRTTRWYGAIVRTAQCSHCEAWLRFDPSSRIWTAETVVEYSQWKPPLHRLQCDECGFVLGTDRPEWYEGDACPNCGTSELVTPPPEPLIVANKTNHQPTALASSV